jgi:RecA-family ATPase
MKIQEAAMSSEYEKTTVPNPSVDADGEQPLIRESSISIADGSDKSNESLMAQLRRIQQMSDPAYLHTVSMNELYETVYESRPSIIDGLLTAGTYLFVGAPKVGKSFLMAQIAYHVSTGLSLWGYDVHKGNVLYLALEDDYRRLQTRLYRMFGTASTADLRFAVGAKHLGEGLEAQLQKFLKDHPHTKLVIIDTLQKVREVGNDKYSYSSDYDIISKLKSFTDTTGICLLLVHHTRKQPSNDKFDMISGTNGLLGAADGAFLLQKEVRTSDTATLDISARDQQDQRLYLVRDRNKLVWNLERTETDFWKPAPDPTLEAIASLVTDSAPTWVGTPTQLGEILHSDMASNILTRHLNVNAARLKTEYSILYTNKAKHTGRVITLCRVSSTE